MNRRDGPGAFSAPALVAKQGGSLEETYDLFMAALAKRPKALVIDVTSPTDAYAALCRYLAD